MTGPAAAPMANVAPVVAPRAGRASRFGWAGLGLLLPLILALGWEAAVRAGLAQGRLLPPPSRIAATLWDLARSGDLWMHVSATLVRVGLGFALGAVAGIVVGALTATLPTLRRLVDPSLQALRAVPSLAWVPLFILWFGILETPKVTLIAVGVFFPVYVGVAGAIASVDRKLVEVGRIFRLSRAAQVRRILLPAVLPATVTALRTGLGLGFLFVVAAELMGASEGLGYLLIDGQQFSKPEQILAAIIAFAVAGKLADALLVALTNPLVRWQDTARDAL
ncbi:Putative aliphatic sulfonates transport permease protein SsuC [Methylobacterium cerastii]|uniref:Aliphatic sulfonates transport permease protein SsuC n=2 Tax=Methylobacteriaceae TaxID=119045 RepID=A0ABQ4QG38_9HYPH|nr:ABC transporter permease [Methylobacterium sp. WL12]TXM67960.1 ABC transporter permease [Methylobacterium sp. WL120]TXN78482.1 ABC transporter permease [Methylobacterium sp. WL8]GJD44019.1 Putative aliphatic sulfonates transport permease protein SsuC [Methylobacterium cerastii]